MRVPFCYIISLFLVLSFSLKSYAQPPTNDSCLTAEPLTVGVGSCNSIMYTNVGATTTGNPATPPCWLPNSMSNTVWFSFIATKADLEISTNFGGTLANTQMAVYSGACGALTLLACQEDINVAGGLLHADVILHGVTIGNTYFIAVDGNGNTTGTFGVCVQEALPIGPPLPLQDCVGSQTLCSIGDVVVADGTGGIGLSQEAPSCFGAPGERSSQWYSFTAATTGSLCFTITPTTDIDYDFAVYDTSSSCPGTELTCNWDPASPVTGLGCTGVQCNSCLAVTANHTYTILVDRFTALSAAGFTMNFAGTTTTFASPNPTFTATTSCIGTATQFTNTTNGNYTYNWNFGDGFTSNIENPIHTYAAAGTYNVSLLLTAVPGGCQNSITQTVTVNPLPTVNAGLGGTICSGSCLTLSGSTNAVGSVGPISFSNTTNYIIPDGSTTGVYAPIAVSGIAPATIGATSIASVCINVSHTWDSDLDIYLECPNGTRIQLSTDNGGGNGDYTNTCFTTTAVTPITSGTAPFTGTFSPEDPFSVFNGFTTNGTWNLFVEDDALGDSGSILDWAITFNTTLPAFTWSPTTAMTNATTLTPTVCPTATTTYTLTANNGLGCTTSDQVTVIVGGGPIVGTLSGNQAICAGLTTTFASTSAGGTWTSSNAAVATINSASGVVTGVSAGNATMTYTVLGTGGCANVTATRTVAINPTPQVIPINPIVICSGESPNITLTGTLLGTSFAWTIVQNGVIGATNGFGNSINDILTTTSGSNGTVFYTITPTLGSCIGSQATIVVRVNPKPIPVLVSGIVCEEFSTGNITQTYLFLSGLNNTNYSFQWFFNGALITGASTNTYTANAAGLYSVVSTNILTGCVSEEVFGTVTASIFSNAFSADVTDAFTANQNIVVNPPAGSGPFQFQLDNGPFQDAPIFYNVNGGLHTISVKDASGCTNLKGEVLIVDFPRFFTPNADDYNDTWNVIGLESQPNSKIYIFDRYGKLIKQISPISKGWDGTYNGTAMPSDDYWFTVDYIDPNRNNGEKTFKSHFSLKR